MINECDNLAVIYGEPLIGQLETLLSVAEHFNWPHLIGDNPERVHEPRLDQVALLEDVVRVVLVGDVHDGVLVDTEVRESLVGVESKVQAVGWSIAGRLGQVARLPEVEHLVIGREVKLDRLLGFHQFRSLIWWAAVAAQQ